MERVLIEKMYKIIKSEWDSEHFGLNIGFVLFDENLEKDSLSEKYDITIAKVNPNQTEMISELEKDGFELKDTLIRFIIPRIKVVESNKVLSTELTQNQELTQVQKIAKDAFKNSHFYKNSKFQIEKVNNLYEKWVLNKYLKKNKIYIYKEKDIVKGFLIAIETETEAIIDLIAIDSSFRGKGIGRDLILKFLENNQLKKSYVGTQISNLQAIKLYEKIGYKILDFTHIFHKNIS